MESGLNIKGKGRKQHLNEIIGNVIPDQPVAGTLIAGGKRSCFAGNISSANLFLTWIG